MSPSIRSIGARSSRQNTPGVHRAIGDSIRPLKVNFFGANSMPMVIRIKQDEHVLHEWIGQIAKPADLARTVHLLLDQLQEGVPPVLLHRLTISTDKYGA